MRLAPAFALRHGINPYPGPNEGPLSTWIYGPMAIYVNLPATLAPNAATALHAASAINALTLLGPLILILTTSVEMRTRGLLYMLLAVAIAVLFIPRPNLLYQVADHCAIGFGILSCWCLATQRRPNQYRLAATAALVAAAVWSKQVAAFLALAHIIYLARLGEYRSIMSYIAWLSAFGIAWLGLFSWVFGLSNLWYNMVTIPNALPWAKFWDRLQGRPATLIAQLALPALGLIALRQRRLWPSRNGQAGRFFQISVLAAGAMLPIGLLGFFKIGGDTNLLHSWSYLLPPLLLWWLTHDALQGNGCTLRMVIVAAFGLLLHHRDLTAFSERPFTGHFDAAAKVMAKYPHSLWFPQNPVLTYYADRELWHSEDGISTRYLAGQGLIEKKDLHRHLPREMQGVAYLSFTEFPTVLQLLPEFKERARFPYWIVYTRATTHN